MSLYQLEASRGFDGINRKEGVIRGVSVIEGGIEAVGHKLHVDDCCVRQMHDLAVEMGSVPVKLNHGSGADAVVGYLNNFRQDDNRLRADLNLLKAHEKFDHLIEMAERMPAGIGLSASFRGQPEQIGDQKYARVAKLVSVDWVAAPAANTTGLFSAKEDVDASRVDMDSSNPSNADILKALAEFQSHVGEKLTELEEFRSSVLTGFNEAIAEDEELSDEQIDAIIDDMDDDAVEALLAEVEGTAEAEADADSYDDSPDYSEAEAEGEAEPVLAGESAEFAALNDKLDFLLAEREAMIEAAEQDQAQAEFNAAEESVTELAEKYKVAIAENDALRESIRTGNDAGISAPSIGSGDVANDPNATEFEARVDSLMKTENINFSDASERINEDFPTLYEKHLASKGITQLSA